MSERDQHERGRAAAPVGPLPEGLPPPLSRREALARERAAAGRSRSAHLRAGAPRAGAPRTGATQKLGLALAATGLVLAVTAPSATQAREPAASAAAATPPAAAPVVSAAAGSALEFARPSVASRPGAEDQLHQVLTVEASRVTPAAAKGTLGAPLKSLVPSSPFGRRTSPITGQAEEMHRGQDFAVACSTAVLASAGGTVTFAGWHPYGGGNRVVIDHGNGLSTTYNHLQSSGVAVGQKVRRGQQIALSGTTGASTGCHLHFEVMVDGDVVDPLGWL